MRIYRIKHHGMDVVQVFRDGVMMLDRLRRIFGRSLSASGGEIKNTAIIYVAPMTEDVTVTHYGVFDQKTGGTPFYADPLTDAEGNPVSVTIPADAIFMLDVGSLPIKML